MKFYDTHICTFDGDTHTYTLIDTESGEQKKLTSVTQLMKANNLSPDYSAVPTAILERKAARGTLIHAEVENYIKNQQIGLSSEIIDFINIISNVGFEPTKSEFIVFNDKYAGTIDVGGMFSEGFGLIDIKTTATAHKTALIWQLSLYAHLCEEMGIKVNRIGGILLNDNSKYIDLERIPETELTAFLNTVDNGEEYRLPTINVEPETVSEIVNLNNYISDLKKQKDEAEEALQRLKDKLTECMKTNGVKSFESDILKITYTEPSIRETLDTKALRAAHPEIYSAFVRQSLVKDGVRITVR